MKQTSGMGMGTGIAMAVVAGVAVGAGVALLLAPCSGADARSWLARKSRDVKDRTMNAFASGKEAVQRTAGDAARELSSELSSRATSPAPTLRS
jgi:gas vesicle protein